MQILISSLMGYLIGSIPFALVIGKVFYNTDIREHGSGNLGGTNAGRTLGAKAGIAVSILDVLKATIAMIITSLFAKEAVIYAGFFATFGHCFPIFANFKGGKAVSTAFGFLLGINLFITHQPVVQFILPLVIFFVLLFFTKMVSLSAMLSLVSASIFLFTTQSNYTISVAFSIITIIVIWRHRENIERIKNGTENKIKWM
ncbi:MAG: glycerol-3-phosphate 1-O-acyltransferase PlsY [Erysipelothrix sp.]|nr:glycerol-3-phosphate 1-O-acyltransferase PlsY [Erysipelothrix sp.]